jgi:hypothetical protein
MNDFGSIYELQVGVQEWHEHSKCCLPCRACSGSFNGEDCREVHGGHGWAQ